MTINQSKGRWVDHVRFSSGKINTWLIQGGLRGNQPVNEHLPKSKPLKSQRVDLSQAFGLVYASVCTVLVASTLSIEFNHKYPKRYKDSNDISNYISWKKKLYIYIYI